MTKLDLVLARIKQLPPERQDYFAMEIEFMLDHDNGEGILTDEQWAEVEAELRNPDPNPIPHDELVAEFEEKYGLSKEEAPHDRSLSIRRNTW
ncbi:MAG: hypothetical protein IT547_13935 [Hyphomonadaceae bacterium]|nr:hypothetical protein [Hyphomonadaceae bacterium]